MLKAQEGRRIGPDEQLAGICFREYLQKVQGNGGAILLKSVGCEEKKACCGAADVIAVDRTSSLLMCTERYLENNRSGCSEKEVYAE